MPRTPSVAEIPSLLEEHKVHRVYVVDYTGNLVGIITFKELMAELLLRVKKEYVNWS
jgi:CBS domain-containing protein